MPPLDSELKRIEHDLRNHRHTRADRTQPVLLERIVGILVTDPNGATLTTGDGKAYFRVPIEMNEWSLIRVAASVSTVSSSGTPTIQIRNATQSVDMLSTSITIDANENDSKDAATPVDINIDNSTVVEGDQVNVDVDVAGTGAKGLFVSLTFKANDDPVIR